MLGILLVIGFFFVLIMLLSSSSHTDNSRTDETRNTVSPVYGDNTYDDDNPEDDEEDETEEESSLSEKMESAWMMYELMKAADEEYRMNHAQCGKCRSCQYSHDEERDGFVTTNRYEVYCCSWTGEKIDDVDLYDERVCSYFEMK